MDATSIFLSGNMAKRRKFFVKSHYVMQNVFAGHDVLKRSNGYSDQSGVSKLSVPNFPHLSQEFL